MARTVKTRQVVNGDFVYSGGHQVMLEGFDAIAQGIKHSLSIIQGEDIFNPNFGISLDGLTGRSTAEIRASIASALKRSERITEIIGIVEEKPLTRNRSRTFTVRVRLVTGEELSLAVATE